MPGTHALLSPSAAKRWMNCTAAPRLEMNAPDKETSFAQEGTLAHAYCAYKLKAHFDLPIDGELDEIKELDAEYHTGEMDEYTDTYKTIVLEKFNAACAITKDAQLRVETRLDFSKYIPNSFGTADAIIIADGCMEVIDFKYGKGVKVDADHNQQMMIYALGAYEEFNFLYDITDIRMTIVQPRIDNLSEFNITVKDLMRWAVLELAPKAKEAYKGTGLQVPGEWCQFCKVKSSCRALATKCISIQSKNPDQRLISKKDMESEVLPNLALIKTWLSGIEEYALEQALSGTNYNGYKIVEGRSIRRITDPDTVIKKLEDLGYNKDQLIKPQELRTLTDLEKLCGKKKFAALCGELINKPQGKPTLVPESDKRPVFNAAVNDFKDINLEEQFK